MLIYSFPLQGSPKVGILSASAAWFSVISWAIAPYMWQCWSDDNGANWDTASSTTFPGYAQSMIRLESGTIVCAHRFPGYSVNISRDDGLSWDEGTLITEKMWGMGCLVEVEPNVVLCVYMDQYLDPNANLLAQRFRVTPQGIELIFSDGNN